MGYIRHDAIVVTSWKDEHIERARDKAVSLGLICSEVTTSLFNGYKSFVIVPDGSKEGWEDSDLGDESREAWKRWVRSHDCDAEPCLWVDWAHVRFGGDDAGLADLVDHNGEEEN